MNAMFPPILFDVTRIPVKAIYVLKHGCSHLYIANIYEAVGGVKIQLGAGLCCPAQLSNAGAANGLAQTS